MLRVCYVCLRFVEDPHDCEVAKRLAEHPVEMDGPYLTAKAIPTRTGPDQCVT
jgi:hypothetical protein